MLMHKAKVCVCISMQPLIKHWVALALQNLEFRIVAVVNSNSNSES